MHRLSALALVALALGTLNLSTAQLVASEKATLTQMVDGTELKIAYSRPTLRGRTDVFESRVVPDSVLWTPGANDATTLEVSKDVIIEGAALAAGTYTMWMVTTTGPDWEVILDPRDKLFHVPHPARSDSQVVFKVMPDTTRRKVESLQFSFPEVTRTGALLEMQWEHTAVTMEIEVSPSRVLTVSAEEAAPYLGSYLVDVPGNPDQNQEAFTYTWTLERHGDFLGGGVKFDAEMDPMLMFLTKAAEQVFTPAGTINGQVANLWEGVFVEFELDEAGKAVSFEARFPPDDTLWMTGTRIED